MLDNRVVGHDLRLDTEREVFEYPDGSFCMVDHSGGTSIERSALRSFRYSNTTMWVVACGGAEFILPDTAVHFIPWKE